MPPRKRYQRRRSKNPKNVRADPADDNLFMNNMAATNSQSIAGPLSRIRSPSPPSRSSLLDRHVGLVLGPSTSLTDRVQEYRAQTSGQRTSTPTIFDTGIAPLPAQLHLVHAQDGRHQQPSIGTSLLARCQPTILERDISSIPSAVSPMSELPSFSLEELAAQSLTVLSRRSPVDAAPRFVPDEWRQAMPPEYTHNLDKRPILTNLDHDSDQPPAKNMKLGVAGVELPSKVEIDAVLLDMTSKTKPTSTSLLDREMPSSTSWRSPQKESSLLSRDPPIASTAVDMSLDSDEGEPELQRQSVSIVEPVEKPDLSLQPPPPTAPSTSTLTDLPAITESIGRMLDEGLTVEEIIEHMQNMGSTAKEIVTVMEVAMKKKTEKEHVDRETERNQHLKTIKDLLRNTSNMLPEKN